MLDTFKARLKAKAKTLGAQNLSNARIDAYAAALHKQNPDLKADDETGHDEKIDALNEIVNLVQVAKDDDRIASAKKKEADEAAAAAKKKAEQDKNDDDDDDDDDDEEESGEKKPAGKKPVKKKRESETLKLLKSLTETVTNLVTEKRTTSIKEKIASHEKVKDVVPEDFYSEWRLPEKDDEIDAFAEKVAEKYSGFKQVENNDKATKATKPASGKKPDPEKKADAKSITALVDDLMPGTKAPVKTA